jgi:leucyl aminopeptidase (aminopeptidase T)
MSPTSVPEKTRLQVARRVLQQNLAVRPGERVTIEAWPHTLPWSVALSREAFRLGAEPLILYQDEDAYWDAVEGGEAARLGTLGDHEWATLRESDVYIHLWGPGDRLRLAKLPPATQSRLFAFNDEWYKVAQKAGVRGARLEIGRPFPSLARAYGVTEGTWRDEVIRATLVDPARLKRSAAPIVRALARGSRLRIRHRNGTDLTLGVRRKTVRSLVGTIPPVRERGVFGILTTLPAGFVGAALDESIADGTIVANRTDYFDSGTATGATFRFAKGRLTEATFESGGERFHQPFRSGGKGRDRPGMLRIGLNPELHDTPQLEDCELGGVMVSVGGNRFAGGTNPSPFFGWAITAGASVEVDGHAVPIR